MSKLLTYTMPLTTGLFGKATLLRDGSDGTRLADTDELDAQARSGDYFVMLASQLDGLSRNMQEYEARLQLENIVSDLLYLQDNYAVARKEK